jgi:hypothetical protein
MRGTGVSHQVCASRLVDAAGEHDGTHGLASGARHPGGGVPDGLSGIRATLTPAGLLAAMTTKAVELRQSSDGAKPSEGRAPILQDDGTALIPLTRGMFAVIDESDIPMVASYLWCVVGDPRYTLYAATCIAGRNMRLHRMITSAPDGMFVDHINGNGLDNRKQNLRLCTRNQNMHNRRKVVGGVHKYKGLCFIPWSRRWTARIYYLSKPIHLGTFDTEAEAASAYNDAAKRYFGEFARLNQLQEAP